MLKECERNRILMMKSGNIDYFSITGSQINLLYDMTTEVYYTLLKYVVCKAAAPHRWKLKHLTEETDAW